MKLSNEGPALAKYYETLDLSSAIAENLRLQKLALVEDQKKEPVAFDAGYSSVPTVSVDDMERPDEELKTIKVIFYDTTAAFRAEMRALTDKYGVKYGGIK